MKYLTIFKWFFVIIIILLVIFLVGIRVAAYSFNAPDESLEEYFNKLETPFQISYLSFDKRRIRYVVTGNKDAEYLLLFIHGAPGSLADFKSYLADYDLRQNYLLLSMDRLGFAGSDRGNAETDIAVQAEAVKLIAEQYTDKNIILIGYSYGGPVAAKLAIDKAELIEGVVMCAPLNDPENEPMKWYSKIADWTLTRFLFPTFLNVATDEKMAHAESLEAIKDDWIDIAVPVMHIHGDADAIAPSEANINFSETHIRQDLLHIKRYPDMGHALIWDRAGTIKELILEHIKTIEDKKL